MPTLRISLYLLVIFLSLVSSVILSLKNTLQTNIIDVEIPVSTQQELGSLSGISVALVSDLHLRNSSTTIVHWQQLIQSINSSPADYVLLAGDYIANINDVSVVREIQRQVHRFTRNYRKTICPCSRQL